MDRVIRDWRRAPLRWEREHLRRLSVQQLSECTALNPRMHDRARRSAVIAIKAPVLGPVGGTASTLARNVPTARRDFTGKNPA